MCDFSLQSVRSRPAKVGDKLVTRDFGTGTRGFAAADDLGLAVCVMPGTELAFAGEVACLPTGLLGWKTKTINHQTAIFRQVNKDKSAAHHDALEFPDGRTVLLTLLCEGQAATVLQLPAQPATAAEVGCPEARLVRGLTFEYRPVEAALKSGLFFHEAFRVAGQEDMAFSQCLKREFRPLMYEIAQKRNLAAFAPFTKCYARMRHLCPAHWSNRNHGLFAEPWRKGGVR